MSLTNFTLVSQIEAMQSGMLSFGTVDFYFAQYFMDFRFRFGLITFTVFNLSQFGQPILKYFAILVFAYSPIAISEEAEGFREAIWSKARSFGYLQSLV